MRVEGGDVMPRDGELWVGYSAADDFEAFTTSRTNEAALDWLSDQFPDWNVRGFQLQKSDTDPKANALHLDCCLSTLAGGHAVFHPEGLKLAEDVAFVRDTFQGNILEVGADEMYHMQCNLISVTPKDVVSCPPFDAGEPPIGRVGLPRAHHAPSGNRENGRPLALRHHAFAPGLNL